MRKKAIVLLLLASLCMTCGCAKPVESITPTIEVCVSAEKEKPDETRETQQEEAIKEEEQPEELKPTEIPKPTEAPRPTELTKVRHVKRRKEILV